MSMSSMYRRRLPWIYRKRRCHIRYPFIHKVLHCLSQQSVLCWIRGLTQLLFRSCLVSATNQGFEPYALGVAIADYSTSELHKPLWFEEGVEPSTHQFHWNSLGIHRIRDRMHRVAATLPHISFFPQQML